MPERAVTYRHFPGASPRYKWLDGMAHMSKDWGLTLPVKTIPATWAVNRPMTIPIW